MCTINLQERFFFQTKYKYIPRLVLSPCRDIVINQRTIVSFEREGENYLREGEKGGTI